MPPKTVNWDTVETWERLVASIIASGVKLDLKLIAGYHGMTYHALENRLRKIKKDAEVLKTTASKDENGEVIAEASPARPKTVTPRKPKTVTPKKENGGVELDGVASGRVEKKTPTKGKKGTKVKVEPVEEDGDVTDRDAPVSPDDMFT